MEYEEIKQPLGMIVLGVCFIFASLLLLFDEQIVNLNNMNMFFYMTVILGLLLIGAGILIIIVGIIGIKEAYSK